MKGCDGADMLFFPCVAAEEVAMVSSSPFGADAVLIIDSSPCVAAVYSDFIHPLYRGRG